MGSSRKSSPRSLGRRSNDRLCIQDNYSRKREAAEKALFVRESQPAEKDGKPVRFKVALDGRRARRE